jgi:hypothetical protein
MSTAVTAFPVRYGLPAYYGKEGSDGVIHFAEFLYPSPLPFWTTLQQVGIDCAVSALDHSSHARGRRPPDLP